MVKMIPVKRAREEVKRLQAFIDLYESYVPDSIEKWIVKEYALHSSLTKVVRVLAERGITRNGIQIDIDFVRATILENPRDDLHKIVKSGYLYKTRANRRRS